MPRLLGLADSENANGKSFSHDSVLNELATFGDDLSQWAASRGHAFFIKSDQPTITALTTVANWVVGQNFRPVAVRVELYNTGF